MAALPVATSSLGSAPVPTQKRKLADDKDDEEEVDQKKKQRREVGANQDVEAWKMMNLNLLAVRPDNMMVDMNGQLVLGPDVPTGLPDALYQDAFDVLDMRMVKFIADEVEVPDPNDPNPWVWDGTHYTPTTQQVINAARAGSLVCLLQVLTYWNKHLTSKKAVDAKEVKAFVPDSGAIWNDAINVLGRRTYRALTRLVPFRYFASFEHAPDTDYTLEQLMQMLRQCIERINIMPISRRADILLALGIVHAEELKDPTLFLQTPLEQKLPGDYGHRFPQLPLPWLPKSLSFDLKPLLWNIDFPLVSRLNTEGIKLLNGMRKLRGFKTEFSQAHTALIQKAQTFLLNQWENDQERKQAIQDWKRIEQSLTLKWELWKELPRDFFTHTFDFLLRADPIFHLHAERTQPLIGPLAFDQSNKLRLAMRKVAELNIPQMEEDDIQALYEQDGPNGYGRFGIPSDYPNAGLDYSSGIRANSIAETYAPIFREAHAQQLLRSGMFANTNQQTNNNLSQMIGSFLGAGEHGRDRPASRIFTAVQISLCLSDRHVRTGGGQSASKKRKPRKRYKWTEEELMKFFKIEALPKQKGQTGLTLRFGL